MIRVPTKKRPRRSWRLPETRRTILREAEHRYRNELLDDEERQVLRDRVLKIRRDLRVEA